MEISRRCFIEKLTKEEYEIWRCIQQIEKLPADVRLTECINMLQQAKDKLGDYIDDIK